ncbi:AraC family transcriptional regulator [Daejeonella rubra]|uniref:AraC family transcriptional regulator n=1 Tax=Daejeonella rubra TaxID=990371 RepID=UPI0015A4E8A0|nr:helix-turn-helix domain-containing protein [Daejeonella rubra]
MNEKGGMMVSSHLDLLSYCTLKEPFRSKSFSIIVLRKGRLDFHLNFVLYSLGEQDMFFIVPGAMCEISTISEGTEFLILSFQYDYLKKQGVLFNSGEIMHLFSAHAKKLSPLSEEEYHSMIFYLSSLNKRMLLPSYTAHINDVIRHSFISVLFEAFLIYNKYWSDFEVKITRKEQLTVDFLMLIAEHFRKEKRIHFYANLLCITPKHLSHVVKKVTGKTPGAFIHEMIINEAKALLSAHVLNVGQIAAELKFSDQSFFGKYFKKYAGTSPSDYQGRNFIAKHPPF